MSRFPTFSPQYRRRWIERGLWYDRTLVDYFDEVVAAVPDKVAIVFPDGGEPVETARPYLTPSRHDGDLRLTYGQWQAVADDLAAGLLHHGIGFEDIVTVQLPNWPEMCLLQIALARIGAVIQPMHVVYREREIRSMLRFCESAAIVVPSQLAGFDFPRVLRDMRQDLPHLRLVAVCGAQDGGGFPSLSELIAAGRDRRELLHAHLKDHPASADQVFFLNFTSGTEGTPKGFLHTHNTLLPILKRFAEMGAKSAPNAPEPVFLANSPMTHTYGHITTYQTIFTRSRMVLVERFKPGAILQIIERERVTLLSGTPAHFIALLDHPDFSKTDLRSVRSVSVGGAQCPQKLMADIERAFGVRIGNTYGMGEDLLHTQTLPTDPPEVIRQTVGKPPPGVELRIYDEAQAREVPIGEIGEIAYRGPALFLAYFKNPEQTAATRNADGWFFTGDIGFVDGEGYLHLAGRKKEFINRGGTKIFPKDIEDVMLLHPKVAQVAIVGMPDYRLGERACAYVVPQKGQTPTLVEIQQFLEAQQVAKNKWPERIEIVAELPLTPTGKILKRALTEDIRRKVEAEAARGSGGG